MVGSNLKLTIHHLEHKLDHNHPIILQLFGHICFFIYNYYILIGIENSNVYLLKKFSENVIGLILNFKF